MRVAAFAVVVGGSAVSGEPMGCADLLDPDPLSVTWSIPDGPGERGVRWIGCHDWDIAASGQGATIDVGWQRCAVQAWRSDGQLVITSETVALDGSDPMHIDFDLLAGPIGGMGAVVSPTYGGVRIEEILPGFPAQHAEIRPADVVVSVDGQPASKMHISAFIRAVTGPPGTDVTLEVASDDTVRTVRITRERIPE